MYFLFVVWRGEGRWGGGATQKSEWRVHRVSLYTALYGQCRFERECVFAYLVGKICHRDRKAQKLAGLFFEHFVASFHGAAQQAVVLHSIGRASGRGGLVGCRLGQIFAPAAKRPVCKARQGRELLVHFVGARPLDDERLLTDLA